MLVPDRWYAVQVRPRFERVVGRLLAEKSYEPLVPLYKCRRRWSDRVKVLERPLFAGYVLGRVTRDASNPILTTPGVIRIVGAGHQPLPVDEHEIAALQQIVASEAFAAPWPFVQVGQMVQIDSGPLCGLRGVLCQVRSEHRLIVSVTLLRRSVAVEVDCAMVRPVAPDAWRIAERTSGSPAVGRA